MSLFSWFKRKFKREEPVRESFTPYKVPAHYIYTQPSSRIVERPSVSEDKVNE